MVSMTQLQRIFEVKLIANIHGLHNIIQLLKNSPVKTTYRIKTAKIFSKTNIESK